MNVTKNGFKNRQLHIEDYMQMVSAEQKGYTEVFTHSRITEKIKKKSPKFFYDFCGKFTKKYDNKCQLLVFVAIISVYFEFLKKMFVVKFRKKIVHAM